MRARGRTRTDRSGGFEGSPYPCSACPRTIDPATTTLESGVVRGVCTDCRRTIDFTDRSASAELAERWAIAPLDRVPASRREGTRSAEAIVSEDCC
jgi:hypothetical protein